MLWNNGPVHWLRTAHTICLSPLTHQYPKTSLCSILCWLTVTHTEMCVSEIHPKHFGVDYFRFIYGLEHNRNICLMVTHLWYETLHGEIGLFVKNLLTFIHSYVFTFILITLYSFQMIYYRSIQSKAHIDLQYAMYRISSWLYFPYKIFLKLLKYDI